MKELQYLNKYFIKYKYRFLLGIFITIIAQIFSLFTPKLISKSFESIERYSKPNVADTLLIRNELFHNVIIVIIIKIYLKQHYYIKLKLMIILLKYLI